MIIACPLCSTRFRLDPTALLPSGRALRCGKCKHEWREPPPDTPESPDEAAPDDAAAPDSAAAPEPLARPAAAAAGKASIKAGAKGKPAKGQGALSGLAAGWIALLVFVVVVAGAFIFGRQPIIAAYPQMDRLYKLVGMTDPPGTGLSLEKVASDRRTVSGARVLFITGQVINVSDQVRKLPTLRASLTDAKGKELLFWLFSSTGEELQPGESAPFETSTSDPPDGAANISITFADNS